MRLRSDTLLSDVKMTDEELAGSEQVVVEALVVPNSGLIGRTLQEMDFRRSYGGFVLAIHRAEATLRERLARTPLRFADTLLIVTSRDRLGELRRGDELLVVPGTFAPPALAPWVAVAVLYLITSLATETVTNNAAAIVLTPVALAMAAELATIGDTVVVRTLSGCVWGGAAELKPEMRIGVFDGRRLRCERSTPGPLLPLPSAAQPLLGPSHHFGANAIP